MMTNAVKSGWVTAETADAYAAARWLKQKLGFETIQTEQGRFVQSGNLTLKIGPEAASVNAYYGFQHIAINATDIETALERCLSSGIALDTDGGKPYFNPGVWGTGTRFFNVKTPFGLNLEICQRLDVRTGDPDRNIWGLEHIGVLTSDIGAAEAFYRGIGFAQAYPLTRIDQGGGNYVLCSMMSNGPVMLELFALFGMKIPAGIGDSGITSLTLGGSAPGRFSGPDGERIDILSDSSRNT